MATHIWQRRHASGIIAQAEPIQRLAAWEASTFAVGTGEAVMDLAAFDHLQTAQAKADALARARFQHVCTETCGAWERAGRARTL